MLSQLMIYDLFHILSFTYIMMIPGSLSLSNVQNIHYCVGQVCPNWCPFVTYILKHNFSRYWTTLMLLRDSCVSLCNIGQVYTELLLVENIMIAFLSYLPNFPVF